MLVHVYIYIGVDHPAAVHMKYNKLLFASVHQLIQGNIMHIKTVTYMHTPSLTLSKQTNHNPSTILVIVAIVHHIQW